jgi:hypothetical protein
MQNPWGFERGVIFYTKVVSKPDVLKQPLYTISKEKIQNQEGEKGKVWGTAHYQTKD